MNMKLFNPIKTKIVATIALLFFVFIGAGTMMAMKIPDKAKARTEEKKKVKGVAKKQALVWYQYNSGSTSSPNSYSKLSGDPTCNGSGSICAIQGDDNGTHPSQATVDSPTDERFKP